MKSIWVLEDDPSLQATYRAILQERGTLRTFARLDEFATALSGTESFPSLALIDVKLPDGNFADWLSQSRLSNLNRFPFIVVSSVEERRTLQRCFSRGAKDYLVKPFSRAELLFKIDRVLSSESASEMFGHLELDAIHLRVSWNGKNAEQLTTREFQILTLLAKAPGNSLSRESLTRALWREVRVMSKTLDVHMSHLRQKIKPLGLQIDGKDAGTFTLCRRVAKPS